MNKGGIKNKLELLDDHLLEDTEKLAEIDHWLKVLNRPNGWHYDLDIIWLLQHIEKMGLPQKATILDAGGGLGLTQFILAARGYNVVSLDFTRRTKPKFSQGIFDIDIVDRNLGEYKHDYMKWMKYDHEQQASNEQPAAHAGFLTKLAKIARLILTPAKAKYRIQNWLNRNINRHYNQEKKKEHTDFGKITFLRGTFNCIPLEKESVDLLVSVSAFEHNNYDDMPSSVAEFSRVLKHDACMLVTISAARDKDWFFKPAKGWNLTQDTISKFFQIDSKVPLDFDSVMRNIRNSDPLAGRINDFYKYNSENGLPFGVLADAEYVPIAILRHKLD